MTSDEKVSKFQSLFLFPVIVIDLCWAVWQKQYRSRVVCCTFVILGNWTTFWLSSHLRVGFIFFTDWRWTNDLPTCHRHWNIQHFFEFTRTSLKSWKCSIVNDRIGLASVGSETNPFLKFQMFLKFCCLFKDQRVLSWWKILQLVIK